MSPIISIVLGILVIIGLIIAYLASEQEQKYAAMKRFFRPKSFEVAAPSAIAVPVPAGANVSVVPVVTSSGSTTKVTVRRWYHPRRLWDGIVGLIMLLLVIAAAFLVMRLIYGGWPVWVQETLDPANSSGFQRTIDLNPGIDFLEPIKVCNLPNGTWRYSVTQTPMFVSVYGNVSSLIITRNHSNDWALLLNAKLPGDKVAIDSSGCGTLQFDVPTQQQMYVRKGDYQLAKAGSAVIRLK